MKFGIKLWSTNKELIKIAKKHFLKGDFDYIELSAIKNTFDKELLSHLKGIPTIIHCDNNQINFADERFYEENITAIKEAQKFVDFLNSRHIIIHPGYDGNIRNTNQLLKEINDQRICVENMPGRGIDFEVCLGRTAEELKKIKSRNYCLDIAHAINASITLGIDMFDNLKSFLKLDPIIFHLSDGNLNNDVDEHLNIGEGEYDFRRIIDLIRNKKGKLTSVETPKTNYNSLEEDINNIKRIKKYFKTNGIIK